jgi:hypothetical protein
MESRILMAGGPETDLSEQQQISCNEIQYGCCCGDASALRYWETESPMEEGCTGYREGGTPCAASGSEVPCGTLSPCGGLNYRVDDYYHVNARRPDEMKAALVQDGPAYFRFELFLDFPLYWALGEPGEVYRQRLGLRYGGHAALLIGWDDSRQAWLCKNSWGAGEGPNRDGTFWIAYNDHVDDKDFGMTSITAVQDPVCNDEDRDG